MRHFQRERKASQREKSLLTSPSYTSSPNGGGQIRPSHERINVVPNSTSYEEIKANFGRVGVCNTNYYLTSSRDRFGIVRRRFNVDYPIE
jgi:hypothetical protein